MPDGTPELQAITERLQALERYSRRLKWLALLLLVALAGTCVAAVVLARRMASTGVVRAKSFVLLDDKGRTRGELHMFSSGVAPELALYDEHGQIRVALSSDVLGPGLGFYDEKGAPQALLDADVSGSRLGLYVGGIYPVVRAQADQLGGSFSLFDPGDTRALHTGGIDPRAEFEFLAGEGQLTFSDERGKLIWSAPSPRR